MTTPVSAHDDHAEHVHADRRSVDVEDYRDAGDLLRALTAPVRLAIVDLLADGPACVHEIVDSLGIAQPLVSQHLKVLRSARLVDTSRRGREITYALVDQHVAHIVRDAIGHVSE
jgi:ArsR family transcriptional regulator, zinc-responsive transcriptional repressor